MAGNKIKGITIQINGETKGLNKALSEINGQSKSLQSELKQVEKALKLDPTNTDLLRQRQILLTQSVETTRSKLDALRQAQDKMSKANAANADWGKAYQPLKAKIDETNASLKKLTAQEADMKSKLEAGKISTEQYDKFQKELDATTKHSKDLAMELKDLDKQFADGHISDEEYRRFQRELSNTTQELHNLEGQAARSNVTLENIGATAGKIGGKFTTAGKTMSVAVTAPLVAAGTGLVKLAEDFEKASNTIRVGTGATGDELESLNNDFKAVYSTVGSDIGVVSQVIADLNKRTGLSGESLQGLTKQMIRLAKVTGEDINTLIPASTRMFQDAGLGVDDYSGALDYTFKVSQNTGIGVSRLQELMAQFGGPLRQMGFDWQTSAAMLGKFEKEGVNTELVVGSLRIALGKMARDGISNPSEALKEMTERIKKAGTAGAANTLALEMFGAKAGPDMAAAIREGRLDLDALIKTISDSPETIEKAAKDTATITGKMAVLKHEMAVALEPIGEKLLDSIESTMPAIENFVKALARIVERFAALSPAQQNFILKMALVVSTIGPVLLIIGSLFRAVGSIATGIGGLGAIVMKFTSGAGLAMFLSFAKWVGIIIVVTTAITALVAVIAVLMGKSDQLNRTFSSMGSFFGGGSKAPAVTNWDPKAAQSVPAYASGTNFHPGGLAMVGEQGAELLELPRGTRVYNNRDTKQMLNESGGGTGDTYHISVNVESLNDVEQLMKIARDARRMERMGTVKA